MNTLRGSGYGRAPVYARAARLENESGRPTLDADLLAVAARLADNPEEHLDIVLVAPDAALALLTPLPAGMNLVGVVAEREIAQAPANAQDIAVVSGVFGARESIEEGNLLILDPERGRVLIEPDAQEFARLQEERTKRVRVLVGSAHTPARTHSGFEIPVFAAVYAPEDLETAMEQGADGLYLQADTPFLPADDDTLALSNLLFAADAMGGGEVLVAATPDVLDTRALLQTAPRCHLRWAVSPATLGLTARELADELNRQAEDELEEGRWAAAPALTLLFTVPAEADAAPPEDLLIAGSVLFTDAEGIEPNTLLPFPPAYVLVGDSLDLLAEAVSAGARSLIVPPSLVADAKNAVRELP